MSTRIRTDGRRYDPATDLDIRPYHKPEQADKPPFWKCSVCGSQWGWVYRHAGVVWYRRHFPGTFWERD